MLLAVLAVALVAVSLVLLATRPGRRLIAAPFRMFRTVISDLKENIRQEKKEWRRRRALQPIAFDYDRFKETGEAIDPTVKHHLSAPIQAWLLNFLPGVRTNVGWLVLFQDCYVRIGKDKDDPDGNVFFYSNRFLKLFGKSIDAPITNIEDIGVVDAPGLIAEMLRVRLIRIQLKHNPELLVIPVDSNFVWPDSLAQPDGEKVRSETAVMRFLRYCYTRASKGKPLIKPEDIQWSHKG